MSSLVFEGEFGHHFPLTRATPDRTGAAFARIVRTKVEAYPRARTIHLVLDPLTTHRHRSCTDDFGEREGHRLWQRLTVHDAPIHGSWLNQAEIQLSLGVSVVSRRATNRYEGMLQTTVRAWNTDANRRKATIGWRFTRRASRRKFGYSTTLSGRRPGRRDADFPLQ